SAGYTCRYHGVAAQRATRYYCYAIDRSLASAHLPRRVRSGLGLTAGGTPASPGCAKRADDRDVSDLPPARPVSQSSRGPRLGCQAAAPPLSCPAAAAGGCSPPAPSASQAPIEIEKSSL